MDRQWTEYQADPQDENSTLPDPSRIPPADLPAPRTPDPPSPAHAPSLTSLEPPQPPRLRIKRRAPTLTHGLQCDILSFDHPVPSIELSSDSGALPHALPTFYPPHTPDQSLLSPSTSYADRAISPPKTPVNQLSTGFDATPMRSMGGWTGSSRATHGPPRPNSAWSDFSDASTGSSLSSFDSMPSFGDSCTSPESDVDPFTFPETRMKLAEDNQKRQTLGSPMQLEPEHRRSKATVAKYDWTPEMDEHIWITYIKYIQDPRVTPFKTLPGSAPPLGVCCRVAREAKKSWKGARTQLSPIAERPSGEYASIDETLMRHEEPQRAQGAMPDSPNTIRAESASRPLATDTTRRKWTATSRQTRHRLRALCKRKPSLSPHYQRLIQSRSPSPMDSSSSIAPPRSSRFSSPRRQEDPFSTRDMNFTLATSTASSMQPGGPLAQLSSDVSHMAPQSEVGPSTLRYNVHQKSQSLQIGMGLGQPSGLPPNRLASPFQERRSEPCASGAEEQTNAGPRSHLEIHHPRPMSGSMKRRAQYQLGEELFSDDAEIRRDRLEDMFRDPNGGLRRVRMRGFSMGAVQQAAPQAYRDLSELFTPPSTESEQDQPSSSFAPFMQSQLLQPPQEAGASTRRLGSPFAPQVHNTGFSNTFPRSQFPQGLGSLPSFGDEGSSEREAHADTGVEAATPKASAEPTADQGSSDGSSSSTVRHA